MLALEAGNNITVETVDVNVITEIKEKYNVSSVPMQIIDDAVVGVGVPDTMDLVAILKN